MRLHILDDGSDEPKPRYRRIRAPNAEKCCNVPPNSPFNIDRNGQNSPNVDISGLERVLQSLLAAKPSVEVPGVFHRQGNRTHRRGWQNCSAAPVTTHIRTAQWPEQSLVAFDQCRIDSPSVLFSGPLRRLSSSTAVAI